MKDAKWEYREYFMWMLNWLPKSVLKKLNKKKEDEEVVVEDESTDKTPNQSMAK